MKQQCIQKYGKNLDFVREPKGLARRLKHKFYNPAKSKNPPCRRIQIYIHCDLHCLGNIINQPNKSTQVIMRRPGDYNGNNTGIAAIFVSQ